MTDASDLVERLTHRLGVLTVTVGPGLYEDIRDAATTLTAKDKEIEALRKERDEALRVLKWRCDECDDERSRAETADRRVAELEAERDTWRTQAKYETDVAQAAAEHVKEVERERDEARAALKPFTAYSVGKIERGKDFDYCIHVLCPLSSDQPMFKHFDAARAVIKQGE